ncbi:MAG: XTP/dITP diphosphohydrolase [Thermoplasmata archaeon]|nr:XTP/dITP diphosphohydrolase [Thermoplasmata archaeon]
MNRLVLVSGNAGKLAECQAHLEPLGWQVEADKRGYPELQAQTLAEVTGFGADWLLAHGLAPPFALEDSGLFVDALGGFPGVQSRHALEHLGLDGLLRLVAGRDRTASFRTDLLFVDAAGRRHHLAGACAGTLAEAPRGTGGFGFDPVFVPAGHMRTFAEMTVAEKGALSHRGQALRSLARLLIEAANP